MEPNKLETDFQKKLQQREIQPSENSWDRLDAMLAIADTKKPKRNFDWLYIAAGIIGFIFLGILFFSQTEELVDVRRNNVVIENKEITKPSENTIQEQTKMTVSPSISSQIVVVISDKNEKSRIRITETEQTEQTVHCNVCPEEKSIINPKSEQLNSLNQNTVKVDELLTAVENPSKNEIQKSSVKVDANNLLSQVDVELELSFREKVISTIGKNYKTVKVALANRNQE